MDDVLRVDAICRVVDPVEHHLVEENFSGEEISVDDSVGKKIGAGDGQRTSEGEIFVQNDWKKFLNLK